MLSSHRVYPFALHIASISRITFRFSQITFFLEQKRSENSLKSERLVRGGVGGKVMRENGPVLLVLSVFDVKLFLRRVKFYLRNVIYDFCRGKTNMGRSLSTFTRAQVHLQKC